MMGSANDALFRTHPHCSMMHDYNYGHQENDIANFKRGLAKSLLITVDKTINVGRVIRKLGRLIVGGKIFF